MLSERAASFAERLLEGNERKGRRERLTMIRLFEELQGLVYGMANTDESVAASNVPKLMGAGILICAVILTIIFW